MNSELTYSKEVKDALLKNKPIVALETTIISHGMPYPTNFETATSVERIIRDNNVTPATIGIVNGLIKIGMSNEEILMFSDAKSKITKASRRDIPFLVSNRRNGATTVAGTMILASLAGIPIMATGGIGGVHRNGENSLDISADLQELSKTNVSVVCAGPKSILDIALTIEYLETMGVPIIGYKTDFLPTFYSRDSSYSVDYNYKNTEDIAQVIYTKNNLNLYGGNLICNPIPMEFSIPKEKIDIAINDSMIASIKHCIKGKKLTPFLLNEVLKITGGESLKANIALMKNNALLASKISQSFSRIMNKYNIVLGNSKVS
jgi:pseudouridylate synthase